MLLGYMIMTPSDFHSWHISPSKAGYVSFIFSDFQSWHISYNQSGPPFMTHWSHSVRHVIIVLPDLNPWHISHIMSGVVIKILSDSHGWLHISHIKLCVMILCIFIHETSVTVTQDLRSLFMITSLHSWHINHIKSGNVIMITSDL